MRTKNQIDFLKLLNENLSYNPAFVALFEKTSEIINEQITEPLMQLDRIRSSMHIKRGDYLPYMDQYEQEQVGKVSHLRRVEGPNGEPLDQITIGIGHGNSLNITRRALHDRRILIDSARLAGFDYYSDFISDADYARVVDYVGRYYNSESNQTPEFIQFIGFIKNMKLEMNQLWTIDKGDNATSDDPEISKYDWLEPYSPNMIPVHKGGPHYPTSHVEITYDASISQIIDRDLVHLFYLLAPIHLVFERVVGYIDVELQYTIRFAGDFSFYNAGFIDIP